ncbi:hypothetical protein [Cellulomonas sp.]|uniref:hypothetical protein n=1 Tax=Cellulomonas sp. TaxID=40001 RepID=UPI001B015FA7|nr:hypothetical protein [Cellulomonas sp.]MBO9555487.1 hypothetical protein [Cellulomonas sp.]
MTHTPGRRVRRLLGAVLVTALGIGFVVASPAPQAAVAATPTGFDPGLIISDSIFFDPTTMNASDIQVFLDQQGASCKPGSDGTPCLKDYRQDTTTRAATDRCPGGYAGATNENAASIVAKVARACGINPQVILVTLQKEQGLVRGSGTGLYANRYRSAMGYGCPDTSVCDSQYYGFFNQVYSAASQFRNYALNPTRYSHRVGVLNNVAYHPNAACGTAPVVIQSQATAGLYNYTPYQPNAAALAAGYGTGDSCSSYGNRNFWLYFTEWFGPTTQRSPIGALDAATGGPTTVTVSGWALDPDTTASVSVHVFVDGGWAGAANAANPRADVGAAYGKGDLHGYQITVPSPAGTHRVCATAVDATGGMNTDLGCRTATVVNKPPLGVMDSLSVNGSEVTMSGWAFDPDTTAPIGVHFYVDGGWAGAVDAAASRPDVGAVYRNGDNHGYSLTLTVAPGTHSVCAYGIDSSGGPNPAIACRTFTTATVVQKPPVGVIDAVTVNGSTATVSGWSFDPNTVAPIGVRVYLDGALAASGTANISRKDVAAAYGNGDLHGYNVAFAASQGAHRVCVRGLDSTTGAEQELDCRSFTGAAPAPVNAAPIGVVDAITVSGTTATVTGWAFDPDTTAPIGVHFYVDGGWAGATTADTSRPDVGAVYGKGDLHGYSAALSTTAGQHTLCAYGIDASGGPNPAFACRTFTVG